MPLSQNKIDKCFYCSYPLHAPTNESMCLCPRCKNINLFLCHCIKHKINNNNKLQTNLNNIICQICELQYILVNCIKCGRSNIFNKNQQQICNGNKIICQCGQIGTLISCPQCYKYLYINGKQSFQISKIKCKSCSCQFMYKKCKYCKYVQYNKQQHNEFALSQNNHSNQLVQSINNNNNFICQNKNCSSFNNYPQIQSYKQQKYHQMQNINQKQLCKICMSNQANMINNKCYHLSVCQKCAKDLKRQCPICRATGGEFKKVYKA